MKLGSLYDPIMDDVKEFKVLDRAISQMGISDVDKYGIYTLVASVLHLGNISFEENHDDAKGWCFISTNEVHLLYLYIGTFWLMIFT